MDDVKYFEGAWAIVMSGSAKYIGRLTHAVSKEAFLRDLNERPGAFAEIKPVFDYAVPMQIQQNGIQKIPALTPLDMLGEECAAYVQITGLIFFEDMQETDRTRYKTFVAATRDQMSMNRMKRETGIEVVPGMPANNRRM